MKVKCCQLLNETTGEVLETSAWITVGRVYHVLSVLVKIGDKTEFQLIGDDGRTPSYYGAQQFEVVSDFIPSNWCVSLVPDSHLELAPKAWSVPNFLIDYFDGEPDAIALFESERNKMLQEEDKI